MKCLIVIETGPFDLKTLRWQFFMVFNKYLQTDAGNLQVIIVANKTCYAVFLWTNKIGATFDCIRCVLLTVLFFVWNPWCFVYYCSSNFFSFIYMGHKCLGISCTTKMWIIEVHIWNVVFRIDMPLWKESVILKLTCSLVATCVWCWTKTTSE